MQHGRIGRGLGVGMLVLGLGLALTTLLGPLVVDAVDYPFTETVGNETLGLEAITLLLIVPPDRTISLRRLG